MSQEELNRLKEKAREDEAALEATKLAFQEEQEQARQKLDKERKEFRSARIKQYMEMAVAKIPPDEVEKTMAFVEKLPDEAIGEYFDQIMVRPDAKLKDTKKADSTPSDDNAEKSIGFQLNEKVMAFQAAEPNADLVGLYARAEAELGADAVAGWMGEDIPVHENLISKEQANRLEVG